MNEQKTKTTMKQRIEGMKSHGLYNPWNSPSQNTGMDNLSLLQGIFPPQGLKRGLLHCMWILYQLSHQRSPRILEWVVYPFSSGSFQLRNQTRSLASQADSLPAELPGKPIYMQTIRKENGINLKKWERLFIDSGKENVVFFFRPDEIHGRGKKFSSRVKGKRSLLMRLLWGSENCQWKEHTPIYIAKYYQVCVHWKWHLLR